VTTRSPCPDARETLLLRAALLDGDAARAAWRAWRADADLDRIDQASFRLLPLAYRNLERLGEDDPWSGRLRGFYRRAWAENQILFRRVAGVLHALRQAGVPAIVVKGAALASLAYRDAGARPMADADLLVRRGHFLRAVEVLRSIGWSAAPETAELLARSADEFRARYHAVGLFGPGDRLASLDLHDRLLQVYARHPVDFPEGRLWADAEPFDLAGEPALRISPEHALLHTCFHGYQRQDVAPIRWIADGVLLVRAQGGRIRWDRMIDDARRARVLSALRDGLPFLAERFGAPVPATVLRRLRSTPLSLVDRLERAMRTGEPTILSDYGKSLAPLLRRARERGAVRRLRLGTAVRVAWRMAVRLPRRHLGRAVARTLRGDGTPPGPPAGSPGAARAAGASS
jgi:hypothetical protein